MYKWQENAIKCEICGSIGEKEVEQYQIKKIGLCYGCAPINNSSVLVEGDFTNSAGNVHKFAPSRDIGKTGKRYTVRPDDFDK